MLMGKAAVTADSCGARGAISRAIRKPEMFAGFADFAFYAIEIAGRIWSPASAASSISRRADMLTDLSDARALVEAEAEALAHMNEDHAETCRLYATKLLGAPDGAWRCVGCDPEGLELQQGRTALRLIFPQRVARPGCCVRCSSSWPTRRARRESGALWLNAHRPASGETG